MGSIPGVVRVKSPKQIEALKHLRGMGYSTRESLSVVERYWSGADLTLSEVETITKVATMMGGREAMLSVANDVSRETVRMAVVSRETKVTCGECYPFRPDASCYLDAGHGGLHVLPNGFAFDDDDMVWALRQLELINAK